MSNCNIDNITTLDQSKSNNSILFETLVKIAGNDRAKGLYSYFKAPEAGLNPELYSDFINKFGDYTTDPSSFGKRLDDNGEPALFFDNNLFKYYFLDKYNQKIYYPFDQQGLERYLNTNEIFELVQSIASDFVIQNLKFDLNTLDIINSQKQSLGDFISDSLLDIASVLEVGKISDKFKAKKILATLFNKETGKPDVNNLFIWENNVKLYLKKLSLDIKNEELNEDFNLQEESTAGELIRKESFLKDYKDNINNNIKLLLSIIPSTKMNSLGFPTFLSFNEVFTTLTHEFSKITALEGEDVFELYKETLNKVVEEKPHFKAVQKFLFSDNVPESLKNKIANAFSVKGKNFLQSEIEKTKDEISFSVFNVSEVTSRKNNILNEWNFNRLEFIKDIDKPSYIENVSELKKKLNQLRNQNINENKLKSEIYPDLEKLLYNLGITITEKGFIKFLKDNKLEENEVLDKIDIISSLLDSMIYFVKENATDLKNQSNFKKLATAEAYHIDNSTDASIFSMGKTKWAFALPSFIDVEISRWKKDPSLLEKEFKTEYDKGSFLKKYLLGYVNQQGIEEHYSRNEQDKRIEIAKKRIEKLQVYIFNGFQQKGFLSNAVDSSGISALDSLVDYFNKAIGQKANAISYYKSALPADKSTNMEFTFGFPLPISFTFNNSNNVIIDKLTKDVLFDYFKSEYLRILEAEKLKEEEVIVHYNNSSNNSSKIFTFPSLGVSFENGQYVNPTIKGEEILLYDTVTGLPLIENFDVHPTLASKIKDYIADVVKDKINEVNNDLFVNENLPLNAINKNSIQFYKDQYGLNYQKAMSADFYIGNFISQVEYSKLFSGDMAFYKNPVEYIKRIPSTYTDGQYLQRLAENEESFYISVIEGVKIPAKNLEDLPKELQKMYETVNSTDAQAWITPDRWKFIKEKLGKWDQIDNSIWKKMNQDNPSYTNEELKRLAQPLKGVYFSKINGKPIYLKYSQAVITKQLAKNLPELSKMLDKMKSNKIDELITLDGIKVGATNLTKIHDNDGNLLEDFDLKTMELSNRHWKLQQDLPTKGFKDTELGSQVQTVIYQGIKSLIGKDTSFYNSYSNKEYSPLELFTELNNTFKAIHSKGVQKIINKLGIDYNYNITNPERLFEAVRDQLAKRGIDNGAYEALSMGLAPYAISGKFEIFQNAFSSLFNKDVVKIKTNGGSFIQMADFGFNYKDAIEKQSDGLRLTPKAKHYFKESKEVENNLYAPKIIEKDGRKKIRPAGVFISGSLLSKYIPDYSKKTDKELFGVYNPETGKSEGGIVDDEILNKIIGYRIPNQGLASNETFEVMGILPEDMADTVVAYTGFTTKTGSDFDIDKMYLMIPSFKALSNKSYKEIAEELAVHPENAISIQDMKEMLLEDGYPPNILKTNKDVYTLFLEDFQYSEQFVDSPLFDTIKEIKGEVSKLEYIKPGGNSLGALNNHLINLFKAAMEHPNVYKQLMNPIDVPHIKNHISALFPSKERGDMENFDAFFDIQTKQEFMLGKAGLGQNVNQLMDYIRGGFAEQFIGNVKLDQQNSDNLSNEELQSLINILNKDVKNEADKLTFEEGKKQFQNLSIDDTMTALINAFVDIAKDPYIVRGNWVTKTNNVGFMLLRMGVNPFKVNAFLGQPVLKDYIKFVNDNESITLNNKSKLFKKFLDAKIEEYKDKYDEVFTPPTNVSIQDIPSLVELHNNITVFSESNQEKDLFDLEILNLFGSLERDSKTLTNSVNASKFNVNGKGKNINSTVISKNLILKTLFPSKYGIRANNYYSGYINKLIKEGSLTDLGAQAISTIEFPLKMFTKNPVLFASANKSAVSSFNLISDLFYGSPLLSNKDLADTLEREYFTYIMSKFQPLQVSNKKEFADNMAKNLMQYKKKFKNNYLLQELYIRKGEELDFIGLPNHKKDVNEKNKLISAWSEILAKDPVLGENLIKYSFITSGFQNTQTGFSEFIPPTWFNQNYFNSFLTEIVNEKNSTQTVDLEFVTEFLSNIAEKSKNFKEQEYMTLEDNMFLSSLKNAPSLVKTREVADLGEQFDEFDDFDSYDDIDQFDDFDEFTTRKKPKYQFFVRSGSIEMDMGVNSTIYSKITPTSYSDKLGNKIIGYGEKVKTVEIPIKAEYKDTYDFDLLNFLEENSKPVEKETNIEIKEGVEEVFEQNPELVNIGTQKQYSQYLDTVFPDSKVKDIVYHGTKGYDLSGKEKPTFDKFDKTFIGKGQGLRSDDMAKGFYFGSYKIADKVGTRIIPAVLNVEEENNTTVRRNTIDFDTKGDVFVVFEPEQIHILGGKQDIEGFKEFVDKPSDSNTINKNDLNLSEGTQLKLFNQQSKRGQQDLQVQEKYFKESNTVKSSSILEKISNSNHPLAPLASQLMKYVTSNDVDVKLSNQEDILNLYPNSEKFAGLYDISSNDILIDKDASFRGLGVEPTLLHEILHSLTARELEKNTTLNEKFLEVFEYAREKFPDDYATSNVDEFIVGLFTDAPFIKKMQETVPKEIDSNYKNLFEELFDIILSLFKFEKTSTAYEQAFAIATNIIERAHESRIGAEVELQKLNQDVFNYPLFNKSELDQSQQNIYDNLEEKIC